MAGGQGDDMSAPIFEEWIVADEERTSSHLNEVGKGFIDLTFAVAVEDMNLLPDGAGRRLHISRPSLGIRIVRVEEHSDNGGSGQ